MFYGLIGAKLGHSYSRPIHDFFGDYEYKLFELSADEIKSFLDTEGLSGFNITIPYKREIIKYLDGLDDISERLGAVNTVVKKDGKWLGFNTDYEGVKEAFLRAGVDVNDKKTLVLGTGGASTAVIAYLFDNGAIVKNVSRSGELNYSNVYNESDAEIIVNATPVGMYPNAGETLLDLNRFFNLSFAFDLIYNPRKTRFLLDAEKLGVKTCNGLPMLVYQAKKSHDIFCGKALSQEKAEKCIKRIDDDTKNVVLIGMSGVGKSVIAKRIGEKTGKPVFDTDEEIVKRAGKTIRAIFNEDGEEVFRKLESEVIKELCSLRGIVISTGGGAVVKPENEYPLKSNGILIRIVRKKEDLSTEGRPLVKDRSAIDRLLKEREPLYRKFADFTVENNGTVDDAVGKIMEII